MLDSLHILIVDDRPDGVLFLSEFLHTRNHQVEITNDGQEGMEAVLRRHRTHDAYDLVFAALAMSRLDGVAMLRNLRKRGVDVPMALYAAPGSLTPEISQQAKVHGCLAILEKPLSLQRIERLLDELQRRRGGATGTHAPATIGTASHRRSGDDKPFFGTSRIIRADERTGAPAQPSAPSSALERISRPSSGELQPAPEMPEDVNLPPIPPVGGAALTPLHPQAGSLPVPPPPPPPPPMAAIATPPPSVPPPVAPPSTAFFRARPTDTRTTGRRESTSGYRRSADPPTRTPTNTYQRRHSGIFTPPSNLTQPPVSTTARIRRTISGVQQPAEPKRPEDPLKPPGPSSHPVSCAHCRQVFLVVSKPQSYTVVCVHCGQLNRIDPF